MTIADYAREEAMRTGWYGVGADHLMLGILRHSANGACRVLARLGIDHRDMKEYIDSRIFREDPIPYFKADSIEFTKAARSIMSMSAFEALKLGNEEVLPTDLLSAISRTRDNASIDYLHTHGIHTENIAAVSRNADRREPETISPEEISAVLGEQLNRIINSPQNKNVILN